MSPSSGASLGGGRTSDSKLWDRYGFSDRMEDDEHFLGDRAYVGRKNIIGQIKCRAHQPLSVEEESYNQMHGLFRAGGEHANHRIKVTSQIIINVIFLSGCVIDFISFA